MRVFVAGASGVIGRSLVPRLIERGHTVVGMTRSDERAANIRASGAEAVVCDVFDAAGVAHAVAEASPDAVVHELTDLPRQLDPRKYATQLAGTNRIRVEGTRNLVAAARAADVRRLIAQSIAFAYAPQGEWVLEEAAPLGTDSPPPVGETIRAVAELERQILDAGGTVLRYGYFYGPGTQLARDGFFAQMARRRMLPVLGPGTGTWSFVHVDDAAEATVAALERDTGGIYNIVDDEPAAARDWIPVFAAAVGAGRPLRLPLFLGRLGGGAVAIAGMTTQRGASNAKAKRELGWTPAHRSWREGFQTL